jgi:hypothetical protein
VDEDGAETEKATLDLLLDEKRADADGKKKSLLGAILGDEHAKEHARKLVAEVRARELALENDIHVLRNKLEVAESHHAVQAAERALRAHADAEQHHKRAAETLLRAKTKRTADDDRDGDGDLREMIEEMRAEMREIRALIKELRTKSAHLEERRNALAPTPAVRTFGSGGAMSGQAPAGGVFGAGASSGIAPSAQGVFGAKAGRSSFAPAAGQAQGGFGGARAGATATPIETLR